MAREVVMADTGPSGNRDIFEIMDVLQKKSALEGREICLTLTPQQMRDALADQARLIEKANATVRESWGRPDVPR